MTNKLAIDTNAYVALNKGNKIVADSVKQTSVLGLPVIVLGEIYFGFEHGTKKQTNIADLNRFLGLEGLQILHISTDTARVFGEVSAELAAIGRPIQQNDVWIAALCKQHGYTLLTADKGFARITGLDTITF